MCCCRLLILSLLIIFIILTISGRRYRGAHSQMYPGMSSTVAARTLAICKAVREWFHYAR